MMRVFHVYTSNCNFGIVEAESEQAARDLAAQEAGYLSETDMTERLERPSEIIVIAAERIDTITIHAWETWTKNGLGLDDDMREQTLKSAKDAATSAYVVGIDDLSWLACTLKRLGCDR